MNARIAALKLFADRWIERIPHDFSRKGFRSDTNYMRKRIALAKNRR